VIPFWLFDFRFSIATITTSRSREVLYFVMIVVLFAFCLAASAQQPKKVPRIDYLVSSDAATASVAIEGIRLTLRELDYVEGQNIAIEYRYAEGKDDRFAELGAELVRL